MITLPPPFPTREPPSPPTTPPMNPPMTVPKNGTTDPAAAPAAAPTCIGMGSIYITNLLGMVAMSLILKIALWYCVC